MDTEAEDLGKDTDYWYALINEESAAAFMCLTTRTMQGWRQRGAGPPFLRLSGRCIRYRRADIRQWADARTRTRT